MNVQQENILLKIMEKVGDKLEKQQTKWWTRAGIIYSILILLITGLIAWHINLSKAHHELEKDVIKLKIEVKHLKQNSEKIFDQE